MISEAKAQELERQAENSGDPATAKQFYLESAEIYLQLSEATGNQKYMEKAENLYKRSQEVKVAKTNVDEQSSLNAAALIPKKPSLRFSDVGGMEELKKEIILKIITPLKNPQVYKHFNQKVGGGILMYGPPGCGKSLIAEATAGEADATFFHVKASDLKSKYVGETERNIAQLFAAARKKMPAIIFFDEFEALGEDRGKANENNRGMVSQLLTEMDGLGSKDQQILLLAATNEPWSVDPALRREGRLGTTIFIPNPDVKSRAAILNLALKGKPVKKDIKVEKLAMLTNNFTGADLQAVVNKATQQAINDCIEKQVLRDISMVDLMRALKNKQPSTQRWFKQALKSIRMSGEEEYFQEVLVAAEKAQAS